jgi:hypothetical protein
MQTTEIYLWTPELLEASLTDSWLATQLANKNSYSLEELKFLHQVQTRIYIAHWDSDEPTFPGYGFSATDDSTAKRWLELKYTQLPDQCYEVNKTYRDLTF